MKLPERCFFYSLYSDDDEIVIFETRRGAERAKAKWEQTCTVKGPYSHVRIELPLIAAAKRSLDLLRRIARKKNERDAQEVKAITRELAGALRAAYPFNRVTTLDGKSLDL